MFQITKNDTPWEIHKINGIPVHVKREDLCCPYPAPSFSKIRGVEEKIHNLKSSLFPPTHLGVVDTRHSKAGWGVSYIAQQYGIPCTVYYPEFKDEEKGYLRAYQKMCQKLGAELVPLKATMSAVLFNQAKSLFYKKYSEGYMFPNGLKLYETVNATVQELESNTPRNLLSDDSVWIISISSGTIAAGMLKGLTNMSFHGSVILHEGYSRPFNSVFKYLRKMTNIPNYSCGFIQIIDEKYEYKDKVNMKIPFPCNPFYDAKAWKWLIDHINFLNKEFKNIVFWNIGN